MGLGRDRSIDAELRPRVRRVFSPPLHLTRLLPLMQRLSRRGRPVATDGVRSTTIPGPPMLRVHVPDRRSDGALLWIHGGGLVLGSVFFDDDRCGAIAAETGLVVVSVDYRLAPANPFPAALDDCHTGWVWLQEATGRLDLDPHRIAVGGASAGGGLAAALAQRLHDRSDPESAAQYPIARPAAQYPIARPAAQYPIARPAAQWLFYPMLDDRTAARRDLDRPRYGVWNNRNNVVGWRSYLGVEPGVPEVPPYAVPARRTDLRGLPPAWIGVGDVDLFHDEDTSYAERLRAAGVPVTLDVVPGAPHGFHGWGKGTRIADDFTARALAWLRGTLGQH